MMPAMRVSHETIYLSLFVQSRGALRRELTAHLRSGRVTAPPAGPPGRPGAGPDHREVMISERPAEAHDRAVPGHWEGDLLLGKCRRRSRRWSSAPARFVPARRAARTADAADASRRDRREHRDAARAAAPLADLGSGQGDGRARPLHHRQRHRRSTSAIRAARGSAAATRTPTACCASTSPRAPTSPSRQDALDAVAARAQRPASQDARLDDTIREARRAHRRRQLTVRVHDQPDDGMHPGVIPRLARIAAAARPSGPHLPQQSDLPVRTFTTSGWCTDPLRPPRYLQPPTRPERCV